MSFKPIEPKRDEFRRYLERSGIIEALTKVFSKLVDEKARPENPLQYITEHLGDAVVQTDSVAHLHAELDEARSQIQKLKSIVNGEKVEVYDIPNKKREHLGEAEIKSIASVNNEKDSEN